LFLPGCVFGYCKISNAVNMVDIKIDKLLLLTPL
jgi:hypothetical protein